MKVYGSSKLKHREMWLGFETSLRHRMMLVSSWHLSGKITGQDKLDLMWHRYLDEIKLCDRLILYVEEGERLKGALFEVGAAIAMGKEVFVFREENISTYELEKICGTWLSHYNVTITDSWEVALS